MTGTISSCSCFPDMYAVVIQFGLLSLQNFSYAHFQHLLKGSLLLSCLNVSTDIQNLSTLVSMKIEG